jgi:hexokinase
VGRAAASATAAAATKASRARAMRRDMVLICNAATSLGVRSAGCNACVCCYCCYAAGWSRSGSSHGARSNTYTVIR